MSGKMSDVVITGWGAVSAAGCGREATTASFLRTDGPIVQPVDLADGYHRQVGARYAALVDASGFGDWLAPRAARRMSPPSRFAVVAARIAVADADIELGGGDISTAVVTSTSWGPSSCTEELLVQILQSSPTAASPFLFSEAVANAPAAQIALAFKAKGPNLTVTQREVGPLIALARAAGEIGDGRCQSALVAAVDEVNPVLHAVLDRYGALAGSRASRRGSGTSGEGDARGETARPFDRHRHGMVLAEGGTAIVLEDRQRADERGARPVAALIASGCAFDARAPVTGWQPDGEVVAPLIMRSLERAGIDLGSIGLVVSGAAGSPGGDRAEATLLRALWPTTAELPPVVVPKAYTGEHGGGLLAGAMLAIEGAEMAPTPGFTTIDPELGIEPFTGGAVPDSECCLVVQCAVGGSVAWTVLEGCR